MACAARPSCYRGGDVGEFQVLRREPFKSYNPCTREEADYVESIVGYKWRIAHCKRVQAKFCEALHAVAGVYPPAEHICEPDPHRWQHRNSLLPLVFSPKRLEMSDFV